MKKLPPHWHDVYPAGTKEGDEEFTFFIALTRHPKKLPWRSTSMLVKETGLSPEKVDRLIAKYEKLGMIFINPKNDTQWGYWELNQELVPEQKISIRDKDHIERLGRKGIEYKID
jgi:hypothetical protein